MGGRANHPWRWISSYSSYWPPTPTLLVPSQPPISFTFWRCFHFQNYSSHHSCIFSLSIFRDDRLTYKFYTETVHLDWCIYLSCLGKYFRIWKWKNNNNRLVLMLQSQLLCNLHLRLRQIYGTFMNYVLFHDEPRRKLHKSKLEIISSLYLNLF